MANKVSMIVAVDKNGNIGYAGDAKLPWHIPEDLKFFKEKTHQSPIIMGSNTFNSLPRVLPNRTHFVVSSKRPDLITCDPNVFVVPSLELAIELTHSLSKESFIIGGAQLYNYALDNKLINKIYLTKVNTVISGDNLVGIRMNIIKRDFHYNADHTLEISSVSGLQLKIKTYYRNF